MRISIILLAMGLLLAYAIPSMAAECEKGQSCGQSCGKAEMGCGKAEMACSKGGCGGECACKGECKEGCKCGCEGMCKGEGACMMGGKACMKGEGSCMMGGKHKMRPMRDRHTACMCKPCKEGCRYGERCNTCMVRESCEMRGEPMKAGGCPMMKGGCEMGGNCGDKAMGGCPMMKGGEKGMRGGCPMMKGERDKGMCKECPMMKGGCPMERGKMRGHKHYGMMRGEGPGMMEHKTQYAVDRGLELMPCQKTRLHNALEKNTDMSFKIMDEYFNDRCRSLDEVNQRMTMMNYKLDKRTRAMLNPMQNAAFPEHMYMNYGMKVWGNGYHPGAKYVFRKLRDKYMTDYDDWGRPEPMRQVEIVIVEGEGE